MEEYQVQAENFLKNETQFRLGFLSSEASNPITAHLDSDFGQSAETGVKTLFRCDAALESVLRKALADSRFAEMREAFSETLRNGGKIVFSGCGATGRLAILLEALWIDRVKGTGREHQVRSIMTGGDYALIRAVEFYEDHAEFGRRQAAAENLRKGDVLVGITATGETASILGTVLEAAERGAKVFLLICVEKDIPMRRLERCRSAYAHPNVTVLDMPCGGMAITGSTRMQSTTLEMVVACAALEEAAFGKTVSYADAFAELVGTLSGGVCPASIARAVELETGTYSGKGFVTYFSEDFLLDILTDTTERTPTFMLPAFRKNDDTVSPVSWAFVKNPSCSTPEAWKRCLRREPRCLDWKERDFREMGAEEILRNGIPETGAAELLKFPIGREAAPERCSGKKDVAFRIGVDRLPEMDVSAYPATRSMLLGKQSEESDFPVPFNRLETPLKLFEHLAVKLVMNVLSTGTMVKLGRVTGNSMTCLNVSNKKLVDRGIRLISEQCGLPYEEACVELFRGMALCKGTGDSPVRSTILRLKGNGRNS